MTTTQTTSGSTRQLNLSLSKPQSKAFRRILGDDCKGNQVNLEWGRGVGKSWFIRLMCWMLVQKWDHRTRPGASAPGVRIFFLMPSLVQFKKVHGKLIEAELRGMWRHLKGELNLSTWTISFPGGSVIQAISAEQREGLAGIRCDVVVTDECDDVDIETQDALVGPWLSEPHSLQLRIFAGTPRKGRYGLLYRQRRLAKEKQRGCYSYHATYLDVPQYVDPSYVESERAKVTPELFRREWLCDYDSAEGLVYSMFDERFHVREPDPRVVWSEYLVGVDHGYEDPAVFLLIGVAGSGRDAVCHVLYEHFQTKAVASDLAKQVPHIAALCRGRRATWYCDPSQPAMIETYRRAGASIASADNTIEDGVSHVANVLSVRNTDDGRKYARLYVSPKCTNLIREFGLYRRKRDPRNKDRILDDIQDRDNHGMDALRYALFTKFGGPERTRIESGAG